MKTLLFLLLLSSAFVMNSQDPNTVWANISPNTQGQMRKNIISGKKSFQILPAKSSVGAGVFNMEGKVPEPLKKAWESGGASVMIYQTVYHDICPNETDDETYPVIWLLHLDPTDLDNVFITDMQKKTASVRVTGRMDKYVPAADFCETQAMQLSESGLGGININLKTTIHHTPRGFVALSNNSGSEYALHLKEMRRFFRQHVLNYLREIKEYEAKPHVTGFEAGGVGDVDPGGLKPVPEGYEDSKWKSISDGLVSIKKSLDVLSLATSITDFASKGVNLFGPAKLFNKEYNEDAFGFIGAAAGISGIDPSSIAEGHINNTVHEMVAMYAEINKKYASNGNTEAMDLQQKATVTIDDPRVYDEALDVNRIAYQLNDAFDRIDDLEEQLEGMKFPKKPVSGSVWGPGIWQSVTTLETYGVSVGQAASSTAYSESMAAASPEMFESLKNAGFEIPESIRNMNIDSIMNDAQQKMDGKVDIDIKAPLLTGIVGTTKMAYVRGQKVQTTQIIFSFSSPDEPLELPWLDNPTIFDGNDHPDDNDEPKPLMLYVATDGNDANSGTKPAPFATLQKALNVAQSHRKNEVSVVIIIKDGIYKQSAKVDWSSWNGVASLNIQAEHTHQAIFTGTEPVSNTISWIQNKGNGYFNAVPPLHPSQWSYTPGGNPINNPVPVVSVNGTKLIHLPTALPAGMKGVYSFGTSAIVVAPPEGISNLNTADVEVSIRKYAISIQGGGDVQVSGLRLVNYPFPVPHNTPGISHNGNVQVLGCKFD